MGEARAANDETAGSATHRQRGREFGQPRSRSRFQQLKAVRCAALTMASPGGVLTLDVGLTGDLNRRSDLP